MTEHNRSGTGMAYTSACGGCSGSVKYTTCLPVVIQIKVKSDSKRNATHCLRSDRNGRIDDSRPHHHRSSSSQSMTSRSTGSSEIVDRMAKKQMKGQLVKQRMGRADPLISGDLGQCDKWRIFQRTPYRRPHANGSVGKSQSSSDDSYCRCDEIESSHPKFSMDRRRTRTVVRKQYPSSNDLGETHPSNSHSHSDKTFSIHSTSSTNRVSVRRAINSTKKPAVKTINRTKDRGVTEKHTLAYYVADDRPKIHAEPTKPATKMPLPNNVKWSPDGFCELNYRTIIAVLNGTRVNDKIAILEGIRWRLTGSTEAEREKTLKDVARHDLFGVRYPNGAKTRLETLLWPMSESSEHRIQKYVAKLLYAMVSMKTGRDYIRNISIIRLLAWSNSISSPPVLFEHRPLVDMETAEYLVGAMMELSAIEFHREDMINAELISWLVSHMTDVEYSGSAFQFQCICKIIIELITARENHDYLRHKDISQMLILLVRLLENKRLEACKLLLLTTISVLSKQSMIVQIARDLNLEHVLWQIYQTNQNATERKLLEGILLLLSDKDAHLRDERKANYKTLNVDFDLDMPKMKPAASREKLFETQYSQKGQTSQGIIHHEQKQKSTNSGAASRSAPREYAELGMEFYQIPTRHQIFSKETKPVAKHENSRYFHRKFLSLPVVTKPSANPLSLVSQPNAPPSVLVTQPTLQHEASMVKSHTSPEIKISDRQSSAEEQQHAFNEAKASLHASDGGIISSAQIHRHRDDIDYNTAEAGATPMRTEQFRNQFRYANMRSSSLDSDVIIGVFDGNIDSSDAGELTKANTRSNAKSGRKKSQDKTVVGSMGTMSQPAASASTSPTPSAAAATTTTDPEAKRPTSIAPAISKEVDTSKSAAINNSAPSKESESPIDERLSLSITTTYAHKYTGLATSAPDIRKSATVEVPSRKFASMPTIFDAEKSISFNLNLNEQIRSISNDTQLQPTIIHITPASGSEDNEPSRIESPSHPAPAAPPIIGTKAIDGDVEAVKSSDTNITGPSEQ